MTPLLCFRTVFSFFTFTMEKWGEKDKNSPASVDDGVVGHAGGGERGTEQGHVFLLVLGLVVLSVRGA